MTSPANQILLDDESRSWRRRLGALPWAVLEELAHQAEPSADRWITAIGVRDLGTALGVTKDTAARALTTLRSARLITPARAQTSNGRSRPGYQLHLPDGITIRCGPDNHDSSRLPDAVCPDVEDTRGLEGEDNIASSPGLHRARPWSTPVRPAKRRSSKTQHAQVEGPNPEVQPRLFDHLAFGDRSMERLLTPSTSPPVDSPMSYTPVPMTVRTNKSVATSRQRTASVRTEPGNPAGAARVAAGGKRSGLVSPSPVQEESQVPHSIATDPAAQDRKGIRAELSPARSDYADRRPEERMTLTDTDTDGPAQRPSGGTTKVFRSVHPARLKGSLEADQ